MILDHEEYNKNSKDNTYNKDQFAAYVQFTRNTSTALILCKKSKREQF